MSAMISEIGRALSQSSQIAVISHYNPDADAYGSSLALYIALGSLGKRVSIVNESGVLDAYRFLPNIEDMRQDFVGVQSDLLLVCDCGDIKRVGDSLIEAVQSHPQVVNIDHHASNTGFGHINYVDENASSASEMVFNLLEELGLLQKLPNQEKKSVAVALYTGLVADTGSFRYSNTGKSCFRAAQCLLDMGAQPSEVAQNLYGNNSLASVRLQAAALSKLEMLEDSKVCLMLVDADLLNKYQAKRDDIEGLVEKGRDISGVQVSVLIRWDNQIWHVSLRSKQAAHDVSVIAQGFGGGGHKFAAAFRWKGELVDLRKQLLNKLSQMFSGSGS